MHAFLRTWGYLLNNKIGVVTENARVKSSNIFKNIKRHILALKDTPIDNAPMITKKYTVACVYANVIIWLSSSKKYFAHDLYTTISSIEASVNQLLLMRWTTA